MQNRKVQPLDKLAVNNKCYSPSEFFIPDRVKGVGFHGGGADISGWYKVSRCLLFLPFKTLCELFEAPACSSW